MEEQHTLDGLARAAGAAVVDPVGTRIGRLEDVYYDDATGRPEWLAVGVGLLRTKRVLVPIDGATLLDGELRVSFTAEHVKASPDVDSDEISPATERALHDYYRPDEAPRTQRLRRYVEVSLRREIVRVVREPVGRTVDEALMGEATFEIPIHAEFPLTKEGA